MARTGIQVCWKYHYSQPLPSSRFSIDDPCNHSVPTLPFQPTYPPYWDFRKVGWLSKASFYPLTYLSFARLGALLSLDTEVSQSGQTSNKLTQQTIAWFRYNHHWWNETAHWAALRHKNIHATAHISMLNLELLLETFLFLWLFCKQVDKTYRRNEGRSIL